jgi:cellulose synthase (UDP-forming)
VSFTETRYTVAGAGSGTNLKTVRFRLKWRGFSQPSDGQARGEISASNISQQSNRETITTRKVGRFHVPS